MRNALMAILLACSWSATADEQSLDASLPLTAAERVERCLALEDNEPARSVALATSVLAERPPAPPGLRLKALGCRGWALIGVDRREDAKRDARELLALLPQSTSDSERIRMLRRAGGIFHRADDRVAAVELYERALTEAEAAGIESERIPLLVNLGVHHSEFEDHERARVNYEQALALMQVTGERNYEAPVRYNLGLTLAGQGKHAEAATQLRQALDMIPETDQGGSTQHVMVKLGLMNALRAMGDAEGANALLEQIGPVVERIGDPGLLVSLQLAEVELLRERAEPAAALELLGRVDTQKASTMQAQQIQRATAQSLAALGRSDEALERWQAYHAMRMEFLQGRNLERLAAMEAHLREREQSEQQARIEALQRDSQLQSLQLQQNRRSSKLWLTAGLVVLVLGAGLLVWQRRMNQRLDRASRTDPLTGLPNRRDLVAQLDAIQRTDSGRHALLLIDVDHFKQVNDRHGHDAGDRVLCEIAQRLARGCGGASSVARWGGEEFLLRVPAKDAATAGSIAERWRCQLSQPIALGDEFIAVQVSIGFCALPLFTDGDGCGWQSSLNLADQALYMAKSAGRNGWAGIWGDLTDPDWPTSRVAAELTAARSQRVVTLHSLRPLPESLHAVA